VFTCHVVEESNALAAQCTEDEDMACIVGDTW
jgi:hypothetical protein